MKLTLCTQRRNIITVPFFILSSVLRCMICFWESLGVPPVLRGFVSSCRQECWNHDRKAQITILAGHTEAWINASTFCRWHFQIHFYLREYLHFDPNPIKLLQLMSLRWSTLLPFRQKGDTVARSQSAKGMAYLVFTKLMNIWWARYNTEGDLLN